MIINGDDRLLGWRAIYVDYDEEPATVEAGAIGRISGVVSYCSCSHLWSALPKIGVLAVVLTVEKPDGVIVREVWNGDQVYCPYNHPAGSWNEGEWIKWGVWVRDYGSFADFIRREREKKDDFVKDDLWRQRTS